MIFVFLLLFTEALSCEHIIRVEDGELEILQSPNYPQKEPAGSKCRWIAVADKDRRVILVCPFIHKLRETQTPGEFNCHGIFKVAPDIGEETIHCRDKGFSRIGGNHRMVITYENKLNEPADEFKCYLHAELNSRWNLTENKISPERHYLNIELGTNDMTQLVSPNYTIRSITSSDILWKVTAPADSKIILSCPFTDRPPYPLNVQLVPCHGEFQVKPENEEAKNYHCSEKSIFFSTTASWMYVMYKNQVGPPDSGFLCFVYSKPTLPSKAEPIHLPYKNCDHVIQLKRGELKNIESPNYPDDTLAHSTCRWTVVSSEDSQIEIVGVEPLEPQIKKCSGNFKFQTAGLSSADQCLGDGFLRLSSDNWTIVTYENPSDGPLPAFKFWIQEVPKRPKDDNYFQEATKLYGNGSCDHVIFLHHREVRQFEASNNADFESNLSVTYCHYTVVAPPDSRVGLACFADTEPGMNNHQVKPCRGEFTVFVEGRNSTIHCSERTFSQTSLNNRMVVIYENRWIEHIGRYFCEIYAEEKSSIQQKDLTLHEELPYENCDHEIRVPINGMEHLQSPNYPRSEPVRSACRWKVNAPLDSRIILFCPDSPQQPFSQEVPWSAFFTVSTEGQPEANYCHNCPFVRTSVNNKMTVTYRNLSPQPLPSFRCYLHAERILPENECENCAENKVLPYEKYDYLHNLTYNEMKELEVPEHETPPGTFCRWTVVSPPDSRIILSCPYNSDVKENSCNSHFIVHNAGKETHYCRSNYITELSTKNWTILTYENPSFEVFPAFLCYAYVEKKVSSNVCSNCTASGSLATLDYTKCDITIVLNTTEEGQSLMTPNYPEELQPGVPCRWTVHSPGQTSISMKCENLGQYDDVEIYENEKCRGLIVTYGSGPDPEYHCRHKPFTTRSAGNQLIVTYSNQIGLTKKGFECTVVAEDSKCNYKIYLKRLQYNQYFQLTTPYWQGDQPPYSFCSWSIESNLNTQLYLKCGLAEEEGYVMFSRTGNETFGDAEYGSVLSSRYKISALNKMAIRFNVTANTKPSTSIGCWIEMDEDPPFGPECHCGDKLTTKLLVRKPRRRAAFEKRERQHRGYAMMAAIYIKPEYVLVCAATIISNYYAITSAYCIEKNGFRWLHLGVGITEDDRNVPMIPINYTHINDLKIGKSGLWDIAIVGVERPIKLQYPAQPVCLTFKQWGKSFANEQIISLGWRHAPRYESYYEALVPKALPHPLLVRKGYVDSDNNCGSMGRFINRVHICLNYPKQRDMCRGFEGGPVLWKDPVTGLMKLVGVTIAHRDCQFSTSRTIAMNMSYHLGWVADTLRGKVTFCKGE